jgi:hemoglobin
MTDLSRRKMLGTLPAAALGAAATVSLFSGKDAHAEDASQPTAGKTLYDRLGGYDAISAVVEDFAGKLFTDPKVKQFFRGMSTDTKESFKQKNKNLLTAVTGGPAKVISRPAKTAHGGLNITQGDFNVVAGHLEATLKKFNVPEKETKEIFAIVATLQPDIVERKTEDKLSRDIDR